MTAESLYLLAADLILVVHTLIAAFVVLGTAAIYIGAWWSWAWVRNYWFRRVHLVVIAVVVLQSWVGVICPLTTWEMQLREAAGGQRYEGAFIQHWLQTLLYYQAPAWVFILVYTLFGGVVVASWFVVPPRRNP